MSQNTQAAAICVQLRSALLCVQHSDVEMHSPTPLLPPNNRAAVCTSLRVQFADSLCNTSLRAARVGILGSREAFRMRRDFQLLRRQQLGHAISVICSA